MATQWANQAKAGHELRLDPCHLPQTVAYAGADNQSTVVCSLNERGVSVTLEGADQKTSLARIVPAHHFKGISARIVTTDKGEKAVSLELRHQDPELCVPLLVSRDLDDVLLDWRLWADTYDLPMLLMNEDGSISPVKERSPLTHFFAQTEAKRNSRFLLRCRGKSLGLRLVVANQVMLG